MVAVADRYEVRNLRYRHHHPQAATKRADYGSLCLRTPIHILKYHRRAVAQPCVNGDQLSQWRIAKFDSTQIRNLSTDRHKIWNRWLSRRDDPLCKLLCKSVHWGLLGKWVKYNEKFFVDRPTGQTARRIFTRDGSDNAASRKSQTFSETEIRS